MIVNIFYFYDKYFNFWGKRAVEKVNEKDCYRNRIFTVKFNKLFGQKHNKFSLKKVECPNLQDLLLTGNPVCNQIGYRETAISKLRSIKKLDGKKMRFI